MSTTAATEVDAAVWLAVAGATVKIPSTNSFVYYFPQGHIESTSGNIRSYNFAIGRSSFIHCQVLSVKYLCSNASDEVFAKIRLRPVPVYSKNNHSTSGHVENRNDDLVSFVKILSRSDVQSRHCFILKLCVDTILPPLDSGATQNLTIKDTLNKEWTFSHISLDIWPQRNYLSKGWTKFVKDKGLNSGDSVVFMRKESTNELLLGIRREVARAIDGGAAGVVAAIESAQKGEVFEVDYYPRFGWPEFVVEAEKVDAALRVNWRVGMKVRVAVEKEDLSIVNWLYGKVKAVLWPERLMPRSPWRILEVNCKEQRVNPWEVECISVPKPVMLFGANIQGGNSKAQETNVDNMNEFVN